MNTRILGLAAGLAVLFASTSWAQSITVAIGSEPSTLDPQLRDDGVSDRSTTIFMKR